MGSESVRLNTLLTRGSAQRPVDNTIKRMDLFVRLFHDKFAPTRPRMSACCQEYNSLAKSFSSQAQWRSQKFSTGGALISGFPSYPHNPLMIYLIHYFTKYFSEKQVRIMRKIRLDDSCLNHLTNMPVGFTRKSSYIHAYILRNHIP